MKDTILTTASMKKITSSKGTEIVIVIPSIVSLDALKDLKNRDEFFIALGVSQTEVTDYLGEPRKGLLIKTDASGVVESATGSDQEQEQLDMDHVAGSESSEPELNENGGDSEASDAEDREEDADSDSDGQSSENDDKPKMPGDEDLPF